MSVKINGKPIGEYVREQRKNGEMIENVNGTMTMNNDGMTIKNGSVTITRKGKKFLLRGKRIERRGDEWYVDGVAIDFDGEPMNTEKCEVTIEVHGDVEQLKTELADVIVHGDCNSISTGSGNVSCQQAVTIQTMSGDVTCQGRPNSVSTMSGDINCVKKD